MFVVRFHPYNGCAGIPEQFEDRSDARSEIAGRLRTARRRRLTVMRTRTPGAWEMQLPGQGVSDHEGILLMAHVTFDCRECGSAHETRSAAAESCADDHDWN